MPRSAVRRALALAAVLAVGVTSLGACGDDDDAADTTEQTSPEDVKAPMSAVLAGLPVLKEHGTAAAEFAASGDYTSALDEFEALLDLWLQIEGTIKDTDLDIYERLETAQSLIKDGAENDNADRIQQGADDQAVAVDEFTAANS